MSSLLGHHGSEAQVAARHLVEMRLAHVVASDAHSARRAPALGAGMDALLATGQTFAQARRLVDLTPRLLVAEGLQSPLAAAA